MQNETKNLYGLAKGQAAFGDIVTDGKVIWKSERQAAFSFIADVKSLTIYKLKPSGEVKKAKSSGLIFMAAGLTEAVLPFRGTVADTVKALENLDADSVKSYDITKKDGSIKTAVVRTFDAKSNVFTFDIRNIAKAMAFRWAIKKADLIDGLNKSKPDDGWTVESLSARYAEIEPKAGAVTKVVNTAMAAAMTEF
jgi:hypothetical protein